MEEAATKLRFRAEAKRGKIERAEAEARAKVEADIKEKAENMREARLKVEAETAERARVWVKSKARKNQRSPRLLLKLGRRWILKPRQQQGRSRNLFPQRGWRRRLVLRLGSGWRPKPRSGIGMWGS